MDVNTKQHNVNVNLPKTTTPCHYSPPAEHHRCILRHKKF